MIFLQDTQIFSMFLLTFALIWRKLLGVGENWIHYALGFFMPFYLVCIFVKSLLLNYWNCVRWDHIWTNVRNDKVWIILGCLRDVVTIRDGWPTRDGRISSIGSLDPVGHKQRWGFNSCHYPIAKDFPTCVGWAHQSEGDECWSFRWRVGQFDAREYFIRATGSGKIHVHQLDGIRGK